jgi:flavin reductase (DIM6/NTAB) family NADH-FMN oxidoreductase RutF
MGLSMPSNPDAFDQLVAGIDYPMFIVTTVAEGTRAGCLVGFVTQASMKQPRLLVCLSKANATFRVAERAETLAVHFLGQTELELARLFGEETGDEVDKFAKCRWDDGPRGVPVLAGCKGWVAAAILDRFDCGDHVALLTEPLAAEARRPDEGQLSFQQVRDMDPGHDP